MMLEVLASAFQELGRELIIVVEERQQLTARGGDGGIARGRNPLVFLCGSGIIRLS